MQTKLDRSQHETNALENELQALKIEKEKQAVYVRELEQKNDDLERGQRYYFYYFFVIYNIIEIS